MSEREGSPQEEHSIDAQGRAPYTTPEVAWVGSLDELTRGGSPGVPDGAGSAGTVGSLP